MIAFPHHPKAKQMLYAKLRNSARNRERLCKRFKDTIKEAFQIMKICPDSWNMIAQYKPEWRKCINTGFPLYKRKLVGDIRDIWNK